MKRSAAVLALALASACTQHPRVTTLRPPAPGVEAVASLANGSEVEVVAMATPDGLRWVTSSTEAHQTIDPADLRSYSTQHRGRAVVEGLAIGGFTGAVVGAIAGSFSVGNDSLFSSDAAAGVGAIAVGGVGLVVGGLSGLIAGSRDVHDLEHMPRVSATVANGRAAAAMSWSF